MHTGVWWDHSGCVHGQGLPRGMLPLRGLWDGTERWRRASLLPTGWTFALSLLSPETHREWHNPSSCLPAPLLVSVASVGKPGQKTCYMISLSPPSADFLCVFSASRQRSCTRTWEIFAGFTKFLCLWISAASNHVYLTKNVACYLNQSVYFYVPFSAAWRFLWAHFGRFSSESTICSRAYELGSCHAQLKNQRLACLPARDIPSVYCFLKAHFIRFPEGHQPISTSFLDTLSFY